mgnify:CR=1 FL=1
MTASILDNLFSFTKTLSPVLQAGRCLEVSTYAG